MIIPYFSLCSGALLESNQRGRMAPLRVAILYFSSIVFSILAISFFDEYEKEIDGASAGVYGLIGGHVGKFVTIKVLKE